MKTKKLILVLGIVTFVTNKPLFNCNPYKSRRILFMYHMRKTSRLWVIMFFFGFQQIEPLLARPRFLDSPYRFFLLTQRAFWEYHVCIRLLPVGQVEGWLWACLFTVTWHAPPAPPQVTNKGPDSRRDWWCGHKLGVVLPLHILYKMCVFYYYRCK